MIEKKYKILVLEEEKADSIQAILGEEFVVSAVCPDKIKSISFTEDKPLFMIWDIADTKEFSEDTEHLAEDIHIYEIPLLLVNDLPTHPILQDLSGLPLTMLLIRPFTKEELIKKVQEFLRKVVKWQLERIVGTFHYRGRKLVLIADEEPMIGTVIQLYLKDWYDVVQVRSSHAALEFMEYLIPDVLLADMEMEIHRELRKKEELRSVPFFYLTYERDRITVLRVTSAGAIGCIVKPIQKDELLIKIKEVLGTPADSEQKEEQAGEKRNKIFGETDKSIISEAGQPDKPHILVVDDFSMALKTMKVQLEGEYQVTLAVSGKQALAFLEKHRPDLIFMDVEMPEMDGIETVKRIKENPLWREIPIIFLTGNKEKDTIYSCMSLGAADYVIKPVSVPKMLEKIRNVLG